MPHPSAEELLGSSEYELLATLDAKASVQTARKYMRRRTWITTLYALLQLGVIAAFVLLWPDDVGALWGIAQVLIGALLGLALIPLHEHLHGLAYRLIGARDVKVYYGFDRALAACFADRFVMSPAGWCFVVLFPGVVLNPALFALAFAVPSGGLIVLGALALHLAGCAGDVAFANYGWIHRTERRLAYFGVREKSFRVFRPRAGASLQGHVPGL